MRIIPDYESYDYTVVEEMVSKIDQNGLKYPSEFDVEHKHNELETFFNQSDDDDPVQMFEPFVGCC